MRLHSCALCFRCNRGGDEAGNGSGRRGERRGRDLYQRLFICVHGATSWKVIACDNCYLYAVIPALSIAPDKALSRLYDSAVDVVLKFGVVSVTPGHKKVTPGHTINPEGNPP